MPNRLAGETSPYLQQHAANPVEWYPWGAQALERARADDQPILLSIGYSACHWCHVMAHESFEDAETAALMAMLRPRSGACSSEASAVIGDPFAPDRGQVRCTRLPGTMS